MSQPLDPPEAEDESVLDEGLESELGDAPEEGDQNEPQ